MDVGGASRENQTPVSLFDGLETAINQFAHLPHGIYSQNSQLNIRGVLDGYGIGDLFKSVIGYDDVSNETKNQIHLVA